jgi:hypothetical protein
LPAQANQDYRDWMLHASHLGNYLFSGLARLAKHPHSPSRAGAIPNAEGSLTHYMV